MPESTSLYGWSSESDFPIPGITEPLEYAYYTNIGFWSDEDTTNYGAPPMLT